MRRITLGIAAVSIIVTGLFSGASTSAQNGCGAEGGIDFPEAPAFTWLLTFGQAETFTGPCNNHDTCYAEAQPKEECDRTFRLELFEACDSAFRRLIPGGYNECIAFATAYYFAVVTRGAEPYENARPAGLEPGGTILSIQYGLIDEDELVVYVFATNNGSAPEIYDAQLLTAEGEVIDTEPDMVWETIDQDQIFLFVLSTSWDARWDIFNIGEELQVNLRRFEDVVVDTEALVIPSVLTVVARRITFSIGDDEFEACALFQNRGETSGLFSVALYAFDGTLIDVEPNGFSISVDVDERTGICVGTDGILPSINDLGEYYAVVLVEESIGAVDFYYGEVP